MCRLFTRRLANYIAVVGSKIGLGCNTTIWGEDVGALILWYKGDTGAPLYTVDARNVPLAFSKHTPSSQRYSMDVNVMPPVLYINPVEEGDEGEYKCRVDYNSHRTQSYNVELKWSEHFCASKFINFRLSVRPLMARKYTIILYDFTVPPKNVLVMDAKGQTLEGLVGPYNEGYHFVAICQSEGGFVSLFIQKYIQFNTKHTHTNTECLLFCYSNNEHFFHPLFLFTTSYINIHEIDLLLKITDFRRSSEKATFFVFPVLQHFFAYNKSLRNTNADQDLIDVNP
ncbi:CD80-like C2-set immunoglobulin domain containing protein [Leptotrombidium deliense]|uniref:CD80-like C2-set immunoglobulin domain containing protein n=1 Tax=Leptotrombidium deliense TaxID=299467 RepID=A0A443SHI8_9ACAR|nr:CD80-like C2-set immunoglobulin domain containing protein [Leptotrombidium deliense]